jgi:hypothetical protein
MIDEVKGCKKGVTVKREHSSKSLSLFIAGAQKAGTTSLLHYLRQHGAIVGHKQREFGFFARDDQYEHGYDNIYDDYFTPGYSSNVAFLAKSVAVMFIKEAARRLHGHNPSCKVLTVLRDPVERAYSAYWYMRQQGWETESTFEDALSLEDARLRRMGELARHCSYVDRGLYSPQLKHLYSLFGRENVLSVSFDCLTSDPQEVCSEIFHWIGLCDAEVDPQRSHNQGRQPVFPSIQVLLRSFKESRMFDRLVSVAESISPALVGNNLLRSVEGLNKVVLRKPPMREETRAQLAECFYEDVRETERLTDICTDDWLDS